MIKLKKNILILIIVICINTSYIGYTQSSMIDVDQVLNAYDSVYIDSSNYSFLSNNAFNFALFNSGKKFAQGALYQFLIDQANALSSITDEFYIEFTTDSGDVMTLEDFTTVVAVLLTVTFSTQDSIDSMLEILDIWIPLTDILTYDIYNDSYYADMSSEDKAFLEFWFSSIKSILQILKVKIYNKAISVEEENEILELANTLVSAYGIDKIEKVHVFNTIYRNVQILQEDNPRTRTGRMFNYKKISLYCFK